MNFSVNPAASQRSVSSSTIRRSMSNQPYFGVLRIFLVAAIASNVIFLYLHISSLEPGVSMQIIHVDQQLRAKDLQILQLQERAGQLQQHLLETETQKSATQQQLDALKHEVDSCRICFGFYRPHTCAFRLSMILLPLLLYYPSRSGSQSAVTLSTTLLSTTPRQPLQQQQPLPLLPQRVELFRALR
jgi:hypothetical protein